MADIKVNLRDIDKLGKSEPMSNMEGKKEKS